MTGEQLLIKKMQEGWNINIECKGAGRVYEMTYEAIATKVGDDPVLLGGEFKHAVGNSLLEVINNLFD